MDQKNKGLRYQHFQNVIEVTAWKSSVFKE